MQRVYRDCFGEKLAIPVLGAKAPRGSRGHRDVCLRGAYGDGRLQAATSHDLGQNFAGSITFLMRIRRVVAHQTSAFDAGHRRAYPAATTGVEDTAEAGAH